MKKGDKIGIVACSNGLKESSRPEMEQLKITLESLGLTPVFSEYLYAKNGPESGTRQQRAEALMKFYRDEEIKGIFDVSGGDLANGVLPWLDYETIAKSGKMFWGYSDLTTVVNAITAKTGKPSVLYQIRNLIYQDGEEQKCRFRSCLLEQNQRQGIGSTQNQTQKNRSLQSQSLPESLEPEESGYIQKMSGLDTLFHFPYHFLQGTHMSGPSHRRKHPLLSQTGRNRIFPRSHRKAPPSGGLRRRRAPASDLFKPLGAARRLPEGQRHPSRYFHEA